VSDAGLTDLSIVDARTAIARGELDPLALTQAYLERIALLEPDLNAYVAVTADAALAAANRAREELAAGRGGRLCGIPLGLKDLYDVRGVATTAGSALLRGNVADEDSTVAARLRAAGAVLLGKHCTHEFAWGGTTSNGYTGPTRNPHAPARIPGGSSGGSAASVVAGTSAGSFGTDTCGSVRIPAALCGCVGFKPSYGRISLHRVVPLAPALDHAGPLARTVRDAAVLYGAVAGPDPADARTLADPVADPLAGLGSGLRGLRVGRLRGWFESILHPGVRTALDGAVEALRDAGASISDVRPAGSDAPVTQVFALVAAEAVPYHRASFGPGARGYSVELAELLAAGPPDARTHRAARDVVGLEVDALLAALRELDLLVCATVPAPAPLIGDDQVTVDGHRMHVEWMLTRLTSVFDAAGLPALSVPFGSASGLPVGIQLVGRRLDEATVLRAGTVLADAGHSVVRSSERAAAMTSRGYSRRP
jgi:aspartyl-tRNA(Asn)/glutamyl-tRNA(Gln) amidotransferase subunit A